MVKDPKEFEGEEIDLEEKQDKPEPKPDEEKVNNQDKMAERLEKMEKSLNFLSAQKRHYDKLEQEVREMKQSDQPEEEQEIEPENMDELDKLAQKDWKAAVKELYKRERKEEQKRDEALKKQEALTGQLEENKQTVLDKHPEIKDPTSDKARIFNEIVEKNPQYLNRIDGPLRTMMLMEEELKSKGHIDSDTKERIEKEASRRSRVNAANLDADKGNSNSKKIVLTKDELEFCNTNGIAKEDYAKRKKTLQGGGEEGVEA